MATLPKPQFSIWQAISAFGQLCLRNAELIEKMRREPGPPGPPGPAGEKGKDGFDLREAKWSSEDGGRTIVVTMMHKGLPIDRQEVKTNVMLYRGLWKNGMRADAGDVVTSDGSIWVALIETVEKPGSIAKDWRLACKRGHDGKDGERGPPGPQGPTGKYEP
jgi:integrin beta 3